MKLTRRQFCAASAAACASTSLRTFAVAVEPAPPALRYIVGSCMYGYESLASILPEVRKCGATAIDLWPKVHGSQREQLDELGEEKFRSLLEAHDVSLRQNRRRWGCWYPRGSRCRR